jgi:hypothetical protein
MLSLLVAFMLLPAAAVAEIPDVEHLTDAELAELLVVVQEEILWRELTGGTDSRDAAEEPAEKAGEITFRDLPWLCSENELREGYVNSLKGTLGVNGGQSSVKVDSWENDCNKSGYYNNPIYTAKTTTGYWVSVDLKGYSVAGHNMRRFSASFMHAPGSSTRNPATSRMYKASYCFEVPDYYAAYEDLLTKLTSLYGTSTAYRHNGSTIIWHDEWYGPNNTGVRMSMSYKPGAASSSSYIVISYGLTNSAELLRQMDDPSAVAVNTIITNSLEGL